MAAALAFGFVEASVVTDLRDIGNWKVRAEAIERLQGAVACLYDIAPILPHLAEFVAFLRGLLADNNFKISLTTLQVFGDLVEKIGGEVTPFVGAIVPTLVEKLGDNKIVVRRANAKVFTKLMETVGPQPVLAVLGNPLQHRSWRVREEVASVAILGLHTAGTRIDDDTLSAFLPALAHLALSDPISHVTARALDALAIAHGTLGLPRLRYVLESIEGTPRARAGGLAYSTDAVLSAVVERLADPSPLPQVTADGLVEAHATRNLASAAGGRRSATASRGSELGGADAGLGLPDVPLGAAPPRAVSTYSPRRHPDAAVAMPRLATLGGSLGGAAEPRTPSKAGGEAAGGYAPAPAPSAGGGDGDATSSTNLLKRRTNRSPPRLDVGQATGGVPVGARGPIADPGPRSDVLPSTGGTWLNTPSESESPQMPMSAATTSRRAKNQGSAAGGGAPAGVSTSLNALKRRSENRRAQSASSALLQRLGVEEAFPPPTPGEFPEGALRPKQKHGRRPRGDGAGAAAETSDTSDGSNAVTPASSVDALDALQSPMYGSEATSTKSLLNMTGGGRRSAEDRAPASKSAYGPREAARAHDDEPSGFSMGVVQRVPSADTLWEELEAVPAPERELRMALSNLQVASKAKHQDLDWESQQRGLHMVRRLARHHTELLAPALHQLVLVVNPAVESLRSQISKTAITCMAELLASLGRRCDAELDTIAATLCKKCGDTGFLAGEADGALRAMVQSCSPPRVLAALVPNASLRSAAARARVAANLQLSLSTGGGKALAGGTGRDVFDRVGAALAQLVDDGGESCRAYARRAVFDAAAASPSEFREMLRRMPDASKARRLKELIESGKAPPALPHQLVRQSSRSGFGPRPGAAGGALRRDGSGDLGGLPDSARGHALAPWAALPAEADGGSHPPREPSSPNGKMVVRGRAQHRRQQPADAGPAKDGEHVRWPADDESHALSDALVAAIDQSLAGDWRVRVDAVRTLGKTALESRGGVSRHEVTAVLDALVPRLGDGNAKVATESLEVLSSILPVFRDAAAPCLGTLVPALASSVGSTNEKVRHRGDIAISSLVGSVDAGLLVQSMSQVVAHASFRSRPMLLDRLAGLAGSLHASGRTHLLAKHVLPAAISALSDNRGETRAANHRLVSKLASLMGPDFYEHAAGFAAGNQRKLAEYVSTPPPTAS